MIQHEWYNNWFDCLKKGDFVSINGNKFTKDQLMEVIDWLYEILPSNTIFKKSKTNRETYAECLNVSFRHAIERSLLVGERTAYINMLEEILENWKEFLD